MHFPFLWDSSDCGESSLAERDPEYADVSPDSSGCFQSDWAGQQELVHAAKGSPFQGTWATSLNQFRGHNPPKIRCLREGQRGVPLWGDPPVPCVWAVQGWLMLKSLKNPGVSWEGHLVNWEHGYVHGCVHESLSFNSKSSGQAWTTALPISHRFSGSVLERSKSFVQILKYIAITVLV